MATPHIRITSKQSRSVYRVLAGGGDLTAHQIADKLGVLPNTVYRAVQPLLDIGLAEELPTHPVTYRAAPANTALEWYMRAALRSFRMDFGVPGGNVDDSLPSITFIKNRQALRLVTEQEAQKATASIDCILSGHHVADSTIAVYRQAVASGVPFRVIIENNPRHPDVDLEAFRIMGAQTKYLPNIGIRLFVFDKHTVIMTSYDPALPGRAFGIRFTYAPVAEQLGQLFEQHWKNAEPLTDSAC